MLSLFNIRNKPVFVNQVPVHMGRVRYASPRIKGSEIAPRQKEAMFATAEAGVFSQIELAMIRTLVRSGMANAKAKGKQIGRPQVTADSIPAIFLRHYPAYKNGQLNVSELARVCDLSRTTVYKYLSLLEGR